MTSNLDLIRSTYEGPSEENGKHLLAALAPDAEWIEAAGFPYAGTYVGPEAIIANVFQRLATEWIDYRAEVASYVEEGDQVVAFGFYSGTYKATGRSMRASLRPSLHAQRRQDRPHGADTSTATWSSKR